MTDIRTALQQEQKLGELIRRIRGALYEEITSQKIPGVQIEDTPFPCAIVSLSTARGFGLTLTPSYYLQRVQADIVDKRLAGANTVTDLLNRCKEMVETRIVKSNHNTYVLNPVTVNIIQKFIET